MDTVDTEQLLLATNDEQFKTHHEQIIQVLCNRVADFQENVSEIDAENVEGIFNLTVNKLEKSTSLTSNMINVLLILLTNTTSSETNSQTFIHYIQRDETKFQIIINSFLDYYPQTENFSGDDWSLVDSWQHMSSVLCNICRLEDGRKLVLNNNTAILSRLVHQVRSPIIISIVRLTI